MDESAQYLLINFVLDCLCQQKKLLSLQYLNKLVYKSSSSMDQLIKTEWNGDNNLTIRVAIITFLYQLFQFGS